MVENLREKHAQRESVIDALKSRDLNREQEFEAMKSRSLNAQVGETHPEGVDHGRRGRREKHTAGVGGRVEESR